MWGLEQSDGGSGHGCVWKNFADLPFPLEHFYFSFLFFNKPDALLIYY